MKTLSIGVDVGGTNTDAVAVEGREVLVAVKRPTSSDVFSGLVAAVRELLNNPDVDAGNVGVVMIGTTQFTNAVVEAKELEKVGVIRLSGHATQGIAPMIDWPAGIRSAVEGPHFYLSGGYEYDGREISSIVESEISDVVKRLEASGISAIALSGVFSPVNPLHEQLVASLIESRMPGALVSQSHEIGRIGMIERENATILNSALRPLATKIVSAFERSIAELGIEAPLFVTQNDGTLMDSGHARKYPVTTFASGPTNSMRGAAFLSGERHCAIIDIGGTTTDVGILRNGFPREAPLAVDIAGVRTNFRMPDLLSVGIGGGSIVRTADAGITVGPDSVGYRLTEKSLVFGGGTLTATDIAVAGGTTEIGDAGLVAHLDRKMVEESLEVIRSAIAEALDRMKTGPDPIPAVLVGGGSILLGDDLAGTSRLVRPEMGAVANAIGAAMAQVGGQVDQIATLVDQTRDQALASAKREAVERCASAGAQPETIRIVDVEEVPLAYLPSNSVRFTVRAVGDLR